jgi:transaldolase
MPVDLGALKVFADGADRAGILRYRQHPLIRGFTTNPTLMRKAGVDNYESFALELVELVPELPISFEVFADDFDDMERQALKIAAWGTNVYVKIPVTDTTGRSTVPLQRRLAQQGVQTNVTALMTVPQVAAVADAIASGPSAFISVFAGRIADTGRDPVQLLQDALAVIADRPHLEMIWSSPRELLNIVQAAAIGCHVITVTYDLLEKLPVFDKDLDEYSLETVRMFYDDAARAGYSL